ncbi:MAG: 1-deoxy-D-xylulose-5-phosphate reductoisomerase [Chloroflexi bacterium]|nr:1-deoxy-D-xylulose-5-phosphate reductoisomerase [Chloroflexota bacterium]
MKKIAILGSTGSIGTQTLEVIASEPQRLEVFGLAAGRNVELLNQQIRQFSPQVVCIGDRALVGLIQHPRVLVGEEGMTTLATTEEVDLVVVATSGHGGLAPTVAAITVGKEIALANKEVLVMAGELVMKLAREHGVLIRPIDSEHSALWQCLRGEPGLEAVNRLVLTASGGPFSGYSYEELKRVTVAGALSHPTWRMGKKITVDSATLMNKGLEVIEAHHLFGAAFDQIDVLIHPESIVHSLVEFTDHSFKAQLSAPDMRMPILYALAYPERLPASFSTLDLAQVGSLSFARPDLQRFPCLRLAYEAGRQGGTYPAVLSAADEEAVDLFLKGQISFLDIARVIEEALEQHRPCSVVDLEVVRAADAWAHTKVRELAQRRAGPS